MEEPRWISNPPGGLELAAAEIHLWRAALNLPAESIARLAEILAADEIACAQRFSFVEGARRYIAARGQLRLTLSRYLNLPPQEIHFTYGEHGKPKTAGVEFNLSHTQETALMAVSAALPLGVDVERIQPVRDAEGIARRMFSATEQEKLKGAGFAPEVFFEIWTRKEARLKASGRGLGSRQDENSNYALFSFSPQAQYTAALAVQKSAAPFGAAQDESFTLRFFALSGGYAFPSPSPSSS